jgi:hypothetical protein
MKNAATRRLLAPLVAAVLTAPAAAQTPPLLAANYGVICDSTGSVNNDLALSALTFAIGAGGKRVIFPQGICAYSRWNIPNLDNVVFEGASGQFFNSHTGTLLKCTRTDGTACVDATNQHGTTFQHLSFCYSSPVYAGIMFDWSSTSNVWNKNTMDDVSFWQCGAATASALALIYVGNGIDLSFNRARFAHAQYGIVACFVGDPKCPNSVNVSNSDFIAITTCSVFNPFANWSFYRVNFEGGGTPTHPNAICVDPARETIGLNVIASWFTDADGSGSWIAVGNVFGMNISGSIFAGRNTGGVVSKGIVMGISYLDGISITGNNFTGLSVAIENPLAAPCDRLLMAGNATPGTITATSGFGGCSSKTINQM